MCVRLTRYEYDTGILIKANTLLADHLFSPALVLAELVERGVLPVAGCRSKPFT